MSTETTTDPTTTDDDQTPDQTPAAGEPVGADEPADDAPAGDEPDAVKAANKQAAGYRRKLRAAEQANEDLSARVARYETDEFARYVTAADLEPADVLLVTDLADLRDEDGQLDRDLMTAHLEKIAAEKPHWRRGRRASPSDAGAGFGGYNQRPHGPAGPKDKGRRSIGDVLREA